MIKKNHIINRHKTNINIEYYLILLTIYDKKCNSKQY